MVSVLIIFQEIVPLYKFRYFSSQDNTSPLERSVDMHCREKLKLEIQKLRQFFFKVMIPKYKCQSRK